MSNKICILLLINIFTFALSSSCNSHKKIQLSENKASTNMANIGDTIHLKLGQTILLSGKQTCELTFTSVLEDSRCPKDAQCIWAGNIGIELTIQQAGETIVKTLNSHSSVITPVIAFDYSFELIEVSPYPGEQGFDIKNYTARIVFN